jgi:hypothetical protein
MLVTYPNPHLGALARPFTLEVLQTKERTPTFYPFVIFTFRLEVKSIKGSGGASQAQY